MQPFEQMGIHYSSNWEMIHLKNLIGSTTVISFKAVFPEEATKRRQLFD